MEGLLIPVSWLAVKLGQALDESSPQFQQAEQAIWTVSVRARTIADKAGDPDWMSDSGAPEVVKSIVLEAAYRVYKNPNRYVMNQAFQFQGQISNELDGDIFLRAERDMLEKFKPNGMWVQGFSRENTLHDPTGWVNVEGASAPFPYYGQGDG